MRMHSAPLERALKTVQSVAPQFLFKKTIIPPLSKSRFSLRSWQAGPVTGRWRVEIRNGGFNGMGRGDGVSQAACPHPTGLPRLFPLGHKECQAPVLVPGGPREPGAGAA